MSANDGVGTLVAMLKGTYDVNASTTDAAGDVVYFAGDTEVQSAGQPVDVAPFVLAVSEGVFALATFNPRLVANPVEQNRIDIGLVRKIERGLEPGGQSEQRGPPLGDLPRQRAVGHRQRRAPLQLGLGGQQVAKSFRLGEVDTAIGQRPPGELARLGST